MRGRSGFAGDEHELLAELWRADLCKAGSIRNAKPLAKRHFAAAGEAASAAFFRSLVPSTLAFGHEFASTVDPGLILAVIDIGDGPGATM